MKVSIVVPSNRAGNGAIARLFELASLDASRFEVIVRDNSEDARKRELLESLNGSAVRPFFAQSRGPFDNAIQALTHATGDYILPFADDDWMFSRGLTQLHATITDYDSDHSVAGFSGVYLVESSRGAGPFNYVGIDQGDAAARLGAYVSANVANYLYYSAMRTSVARFCFSVLARLPYRFSYHDQLVSLMYMAHGRIVTVPRLLYSYDIGEWETADAALAKDRAMYRAAGLAEEFDQLHWLVCGMEGAILMRSKIVREQLGHESDGVATVWMRFMFERFVRHDRRASDHTSDVGKTVGVLRKKWIARTEINYSELLLDISEIIDACDHVQPSRYFEFWSAL